MYVYIHVVSRGKCHFSFSFFFFKSENTTKIKVYFQLSFLKRKKKKTEGPKKNIFCFLFFGAKFCVEYVYTSLRGVFFFLNFFFFLKMSKNRFPVVDGDDKGQFLDRKAAVVAAAAW